MSVLAFLRENARFLDHLANGARVFDGHCNVGAWGLRLNTRKSAIVHFDAGFSWLGYFFVRREYYQL